LKRNLLITKPDIQLNKFIADTMVLVLSLERRKMPLEIKGIVEMARKGSCEIYIPSIVFAELAYLSEKHRIETNLIEVSNFLVQYQLINELPMTLSTIEHSFEIKDIPELHDRIIAGSAREISVPILTNDPVIRSSSYIECIWD